MALPSIFINSLFFCILITLSPSRAQTTLIPNPFTYSVEYFNQTHLDSLIPLGYASIGVTGALQITPDTIGEKSNRLNKSGRFMLRKRFKLWEESSTSSSQNNTISSGIVASFKSSFLVNFFVPAGEQSGEGFAFVIAPDLGIPSNSHGEWLGLTNATLNSSSSSKFVAIEFDTKMQDYDLDDNHVGLDINSVRSNKSISLSDFNITLAPVDREVKYMVWVEYNGTTKLLEVYMDEENRSKPIRPILSLTINLKDYVNQYSYLGFSASTGTTAQLNCVLEWNLTMEILPEDKDTWWKIVVGIGFLVMALIIGGVVGTVYNYMKKNRGVDDLNIFNALMRLPGTPRELKLKDLKQATNNFDEKMKLGQGGFGVVYKGLLAKENIQVAVKQFSRESIKGKSDFLAELTIINRLRNKHLVPLVGWCHKKGMLLLVYEYMPNGSLDNHLFGGPNKFLSWGHRYNIISGVASALHYIHNEYDQMVVHRDLKSSNILLDSDYNARLGDFGLARALEYGKSSYAELEGLAGTFGYIAPESFHTGKTTRESDVYGFGAVVLEVVCGQRPWTKISGSMVMVDWVWKLYREGRILEAVDERIGSDFVGEEAERLLLLGLACSHPIASERPKAQKIIQIISGSAPVPCVPHFKPYFMWPVTYYDSESPQYLGLGDENHMRQINITTNS